MLKGSKTLKDTIESKNGTMVPLGDHCDNKMLPQDPGKAMTFTSGGAAVQSSQISGSLNGLNNVTMMGWVRV